MDKKSPIHMIHDSGYFEPHIDSYCKLGDSFDKGFEKGTIKWSEVTCKKCLKLKL